MKNPIAVLALLLVAVLRLPAVVVTLGVDSKAVGIVSAGSRVLNVNRVDVFAVNQQIAIAGVTGLKLVAAVGSDSILLNSPADATVVNAQIRVVIDNLDHSSVRVLWTTDSATYASVSFGVSSGVYPYRTYENAAAQTIGKLSLGGLAPDTTYYLRINAKPSIGANTTGICNTDVCGSKEIAITTLPEGVVHPDLPQAPATFDTSLPDTSGYAVFPVPAFADGTKTGSITTGTATLTVNSSDGMLPNHWIFIDGAACALLFTSATMPQVGACQIGSVSGNTITLTSDVTGTVVNAAVTWALFTVQDFMEPRKPYYVGYGTIFEWAQGYKGRWYAIQEASYGQFGLKLPGMAADDNPSCSSHPCSLSDPAHRWIVLRTAAGPGLLPPPGVRTGPAWAPVLGAIVAQNPNSGGNGGEVLWGGDGSYTRLPHHFRVENLELTYSADASIHPADATDPRPFTELVTFDGRSATIIPQSIVLDRIYVHGQGAPTRVRSGVGIGGQYNALINSYIGQIDYWRPYGPLGTSCSVSGNILTVPRQTYQRNKFAPVVTMQGAVTATLISSGGYTGAFIAFLKSDGTIGLNYSKPAIGSASITCGANCTATSYPDVTTDLLAPHSWPVNTVKYCSGTIASNSFALSVPIYPDSAYVTEGAIGVGISDGAGPYTIGNNFIEGYGIGFFVDSGGIFAPIPSDVTFRRNYVFWNQDHRITSDTTNGYIYTVRNLWEIKRGKRWTLDGNVFEGQWARVNQGSSILLSGRAMTSPSVPPSGDGISDISIANNTVRNGSAAFYCQGGSASVSGDPPLTKRIVYSNNLIYGMDAFTYQHNPGTPFIGDTFRILLGCQDVSIRHNTVYYTVGPYPWQLLLGTLVFSEGVDMRDNIFYLNSANGAAGMAADVNQNTSYSQIPAMTSGPNYKDTLDSISVRIGATVQPNYTLSNNVVIGGTSGNTLQSQVDLTQEDMMNVFIPKYGALAARQFFPSGATRSQREAAVGWINTVGSDFRLGRVSPFVSKGSDGADIGADVSKAEAAQGIIGNLRILNAANGSATAVFTAPDPGRSCWVAQGDPDSPTQTYTLSSADNTDNRIRTIQISGLAADRQYMVVALCDGASGQPKQTFQTRP